MKALTWFSFLLGERQILRFLIFWSVVYERILSLQGLDTMVTIKCLDEAWRKVQITALFCWFRDARSQFRRGHLARDQNLPRSNSFLKVAVFGTRTPSLFLNISTFFARISKLHCIKLNSTSIYQSFRNCTQKEVTYFFSKNKALLMNKSS